MKKIIYALSLLALTIISCSKEEINQSPQSDLLQETNSIKFGFDFNELFSKKISQLKASSDNEVSSDPKYVVITIEDSTGEKIHDFEKTNLVKFGEAYVTKEFSFTTGDYLITDFIVLDSQDNAIYAAPKSGSEYADFVDLALPISFTVSSGSVENVVLDVVSVSDIAAEDLGYTTFGFDVVETQLNLVVNLNFFFENTEEIVPDYHPILENAALNIFGDDSVIQSNSVINGDLFETLVDAKYNEYKVDVFSEFPVGPYYFSQIENNSITKEQLAAGESLDVSVYIAQNPSFDVVVDLILLDEDTNEQISADSPIWDGFTATLRPFSSGFGLPSERNIIYGVIDTDDTYELVATLDSDEYEFAFGDEIFSQPLFLDDLIHGTTIYIHVKKKVQTIDTIITIRLIDGSTGEVIDNNDERVRDNIFVSLLDENDNYYDLGYDPIFGELSARVNSSVENYELTIWSGASHEISIYEVFNLTFDDLKQGNYFVDIVLDIGS